MSLPLPSQEPFSPSPQAIIAARAITQAALSLRAAIYLAIASLFLVIYDTVITFDQEVKFVWCQRWTFGKVIYLVIRYMTIALMGLHIVSMVLFNPPRSLCEKMEEVFVWSEVVVLIAGSSVLVVRTWLLWGGKKWVLVGLISGLILSSIVAISFIDAEMKASSIILNRAPQVLPGCIVRIPSTTWRPFVPPVLYETLIIVLTVIKVGGTRTPAPVVMRLFLDGTLYYIVVVVVLLVTTIGAAIPAIRPVFVGSGFHVCCVSVGCSRLFLSLHSWSEENKRRSTIPQSSPGSNKQNSSHSNSSSSGASSQPLQPPFEYELVARVPAADVESGLGRPPLRAIDSNSSTTELLRSPPTAAAGSQMHSMLPDIERPSLPERIWPTQLHHQRRPIRPPRSSSLYNPIAGTGMALDRRHESSMERWAPEAIQETGEAESERGSEQRIVVGPRVSDSPQRYNINVI